MSPSSITQPRYHPINAPPYQINYRAKRSGKHITVTKRRITFQFGFADAASIASGRTENQCRGEEHEVVLIWSHVSGKRQLFMDGTEVHMSKAARGNTKFSHSWSVWGTHTLKIIANGSPSNDGSKQFDLQLDGMSYFDFCQIYQLGNGSGKKGEVVPMRAPSIETLPTHVSYSSNEYRLDGDDDRRPMADLQIDVLDAPCDSYDLLGCELPSPLYSECDYQETVATTLSSYDEFSPVNSSYGGNQKSFAAISNEILTAYSTESYGAPPAAQDPTNCALALMPPPTPVAQDPVVVNPPMNSTCEVSNDNHALVPANNVQQATYTSFSMDPPSASKESQRQIVSMYDNAQQQDSSVDDLTACMNKLVNLDDVSKPAKCTASSNNNPHDKNQSLQSLKWAMSNGGRAPTLSEIHSMKSSSGHQVQVMGNPHLYQGATQQQYYAASYSYGNAY